jgi:hypothetical protein
VTGDGKLVAGGWIGSLGAYRGLLVRLD